eukprot:SAG31_NODE_1444_length_8321_cov_2.478716_3_plen_186_part_00
MTALALEKRAVLEGEFRAKVARERADAERRAAAADAAEAAAAAATAAANAREAQRVCDQLISEEAASVAFAAYRQAVAEEQEAAAAAAAGQEAARLAAEAGRLRVLESERAAKARACYARLHATPSALKDDFELVRAAVAHDGHALCYASEQVCRFHSVQVPWLVLMLYIFVTICPRRCIYKIYI